MQKDFGKYFGSMMMLCFGAVAFYRWQQTSLLFYLLMVLRDVVASYFFLKRTKAEAKAGKFISLLAYLSAAIPLMYFKPEQFDRDIFLISDILSIVGFLFVVLATIELGTSLGIAPAKRTHVHTGIYRWIRHPMYTGYVTSEIGLVLINSQNIYLFSISILLYRYRSKKETKVLKRIPKWNPL